MPGQAWSIGFGWVYMAVVQVTALVLLYGIVGKKMALIARKLDAITVADVIRARYGSNALANLSAAIVVVFFGATMIAQFVGGAKLFEAVTGYSYVFGLVLFGVAVILFTTIGGFRGVALTDALCGIAMLVGIVVLAAGILDAGGGYEAIMGSIAQNHPEMLEPTSGGNMPPSLYLTQWLLVGVFTFVLPQSVVRTMGYKDVKSLHRAMIVGTVIIGAMMIGVTALGVLAAGVLTEDLAAYGGSVDNIIPLAISRTLPPVLAGIAITSVFGAGMNTILIVNPDAYIGSSAFLVGGLAGVLMDDLWWPAVYIVAGLAAALLAAGKLNIMALGDDTAHALGMNVGACRLAMLGLAAVLAGAAVSFAGLLGFVGLIIPHLVRFFVGHDNRIVLPLSAVSGAAFVVVCDLLARVLFAPYEVPVGILMAFLGGPSSSTSS